MRLQNKLAIAISTVLFAGSVTAASLDIREEYKHDSEDTAGRIKIGGSSGNHYFGVEMKHTGISDINDLETTENEFEYGYNWDINNKLRFQTAMPITLSSDSTTFKPQVRVQYKFDNGITTKLRYRHEFRNYSGDNTSEGRDGKDHSSLNRSKITANIDYTWNGVQLGLEGNYAEDFFNNEWSSGNTDGKHEWDYNFKIGYPIANTNWRPYLEFGNVQYSEGDKDLGTYENGRQLRSRVGVTYTF